MMKGVVDIKPGSLVIATAGRDKGGLFVAADAHDGFVYIADGRKRKLEKPKRKNTKHISPVGEHTQISELTNKKLRRLINEYKTRTHYAADQNPGGEVF